MSSTIKTWAVQLKRVIVALDTDAITIASAKFKRLPHLSPVSLMQGQHCTQHFWSSTEDVDGELLQERSPTLHGTLQCAGADPEGNQETVQQHYAVGLLRNGQRILLVKRPWLEAQQGKLDMLSQASIGIHAPAWLLTPSSFFTVVLLQGPRYSTVLLGTTQARKSERKRGDLPADIVQVTRLCWPCLYLGYARLPVPLAQLIGLGKGRRAVSLTSSW
jgi:hypothetical protein